MRRVLHNNPRENVFHTGFTACDQYGGALEAAAQWNSAQAATLFIVGKNDQMTPPQAAQALISTMARAKVVTVEAGHSVMTEAPDATLLALRDFLKT